MRYGTEGFATPSSASDAEIRTFDTDGKMVVSLAPGGTAESGVTATEYSADGKHFVTKLVISGLAITIGDNAALANGTLAYTLPAGALYVQVASGSLALTLTTGTPTTDTPEIGIGTTVGSGVNATLGAVDAACENVWGPFVMDDVAGTAEVGTTASGLVIEAAGDHTLYVNIADTWADVDDTAATLDGTVYISWVKLA